MSSSLRILDPLPLVLAAATLLVGCDRTRPGAIGAIGAAAQSHDHASVQVTRWESGFELFLEYDVPEAGHSVQLATHVTELATGEPRSTGAAIFRLRSPSGEDLVHTEIEPVRAGVYLPELVLDQPGSWQLSVGLPGADGTVTLELPELEVAASHGSLHDVVIPAVPEGVAFLKEQQWRMGTRIAAIEPAPLTDRIAVPAVVRAAAERQADITPPIAGRLEAREEGQLPHIGDRVERGEVLAYVRPPFSDYLARVQQARADAVRAELAAERVRARYERTAALAERGARSARELDEARFALQIAEAEQAASVAVTQALEASGLTVAPTESEANSGGAGGGVRFELRSPISGYVRDVAGVNGTYIEVGRPVFRVRDSSFVHLEGLVRLEVVERIQAVERLAVVRARGSSGGLELSLPDAELVYVGDEIDSHTLTVPVHFEVPNPDLRLRIGERIELQLPAREASLELSVPVEALVEENGESTVYVQLAGETFEERQVELGFRDGRRVQVLSGIEAGERVVVEGAYAIRLASMSDSAPSHGHAH